MNRLLEGRDVSQCGKSFFQPCSPHSSDRTEEDLRVVLVICPLIGLIEVQIKEGQPLGLTCASLQDVNDLFSDNPWPQPLFASAEKALDNDLRQIFRGSPTS